MKSTELERIKRNVQELTDLLMDLDDVVYLRNRMHLPQPRK